MTGVWAWSAAVGVVAVGLAIGRLMLHRIQHRQRLALLAIWAAVDDDCEVAYLEELHNLPARTPEHELP